MKTKKISRLYFKFLKTTGLKMDLDELITRLEKLGFIKLVDDDRYHELKNIKRDDVLKILKQGDVM